MLFVRKARQLRDAPLGARILVDLNRADVFEVLPDLVGRASEITGFASHVDAELLAAAKAAGCTDALPRSVFFRRL